MSYSNVYKRKGKEKVEEEQHISGNPEHKKPRVEEYFEVEAPRRNPNNLNLLERMETTEPSSPQTSEFAFFYPKDEIDKLKITISDFECLMPGVYLNDNIINFYLMFLKKTFVSQERQNKFHILNTFWFTRFQSKYETTKGQEHDKYETAFQSVRKWTSQISIFELDYLMVPIHEGSHWSLIVICHPRHVNNYDSGTTMPSPCILHLDSMAGYHRDVEKYIKNFLVFAWIQEHLEETYENVRKKFLSMEYLELEVPQQKNGYDCGPFMLHYAELFIKQAPPIFNWRENELFPQNRTKPWFEDLEINSKRDHILKLLHDLHEEAKT